MGVETVHIPQTYGSYTTDMVLRDDGNPQRWMGSQSCGAWKVWWHEYSEDADDMRLYWLDKENGEVKFNTGFRICSDMNCSEEPIAAGDSTEPISYVMADWVGQIPEPKEETGAFILTLAPTILAFIFLMIY